MRLLIATLCMAISYAQTACDSEDVVYGEWVPGVADTQLSGGVRIPGYQEVTSYEDCQLTCDATVEEGAQCNGITYVTTNNRCFMHSSVESLVESDLPDRISSYRPCIAAEAPTTTAEVTTPSEVTTTAAEVTTTAEIPSCEEDGYCCPSGFTCSNCYPGECGSQFCGASADPITCEAEEAPATCTTYNGSSCNKCLKPCNDRPNDLCCFESMTASDCSCLENHRWCGTGTVTCSPTQEPTESTEEPCMDDDERAIAEAASRGYTVLGCAGARDFTKGIDLCNSGAYGRLVREVCPLTCGMCGRGL